MLGSVRFLTGPYDIAVDLVVLIVFSGNADDDLVPDQRKCGGVCVKADKCRSLVGNLAEDSAIVYICDLCRDLIPQFEIVVVTLIRIFFAEFDT